FDAPLARVGLGAEAELAVDDRAAQRAFGVVVGRLDALGVGEGPQCRAELEQVAGDAARVLVARCLAGVLAHDRLELAPQRADAELELAAVAGVLEDFPGPEQLLADAQARLAEGLLGCESVGVGLEVAP